LRLLAPFKFTARIRKIDKIQIADVVVIVRMFTLQIDDLKVSGIGRHCKSVASRRDPAAAEVGIGDG